MAGWVPYWRGDYDAARERFEHALEIARGNPEVDRWGEARALISLAGISAALGDLPATLATADRALALGREMADPFTVATAQERRSNTFRAMWRLEEAVECSNEAVTVYRDLGARWELASALGDRALVHRFLGRLNPAEEDVREAYALCRDLGDRVLVAWTASELAILLTVRGRIDEARAVIEDGTLPETLDGPADRTAILWARAYIALAEGDGETARSHGAEILRQDREQARPVAVAVTTWWVASLFGADVAGGEAEVDRARRTLEEAGWVRAFREVEQMRGALMSVR
jgi:tetratricopeptide (TPR) repeat protein